MGLLLWLIRFLMGQWRPMPELPAWLFNAVRPADVGWQVVAVLFLATGAGLFALLALLWVLRGGPRRLLAAWNDWKSKDVF